MLWERADAVFALYNAATLGLFESAGKRLPSLVGTSVAVRLRDEYFLFTAYHVVQRIAPGRMVVQAPPLLAGIQARLYLEESRDAAVIHFSPDNVPEHIRAHAIGLDDIELDEVPEGAGVEVIGYPTNRAARVVEKTIMPSCFQWLGNVITDGIDPKWQLAFEFSRGQARDPRDGQQKLGPALNGVSGGGMWLVLPTRPDQYPGCLVGIFTDFRNREDRMVGTRIGVHLALVAKYAPAALR